MEKNMKKYLMTGIAALTMSGLFTSCSHDMGLYTGNQSEQVLKSYNDAFVSAYDEPAPTQTWGFGSTTSTVAGTRGMTRTIQPSYEFPGDADASKFLADVPEGIELLAPGIGKANHYIDASYTGDLNVWGIGSADNGWVAEAGTLYIKGNCDFSNRSFYFAGNSELYLVAGATLTLGENNGSGNLQTNTKIYIAEGAKLIANGELKLNNGLQIYNHGTIETPQLSTNSNSVLYNTGTITVTNKISVENELSVVVNDGTITATDLNTAGSGKFQNNANVTISGTTLINSNNNTWVNNGQYHTGYFVYTAGSNDVINNCRLTVDEDFNINLGDNSGNASFKMDAGAGVVTKNFNGGGKFTHPAQSWVSFNGGPFYIYMGENSVFKVTETATMNATKADYGIYGPAEGGYAVFQAKNIVAGAANQGYEVTYGNNLYVYAEESHFANGMSGQYPYIDFKGNAKIYASGFEDGKPAVSIAETACNPGFNGGVQAVTEKIRVIAEDLSASQRSDFDFNDVVFDVYWTHTPGNDDKNTQSVTLILLAAGGELPIYIGNVGEEFELHAKFAEANQGKGITTRTMMNTYPNQHQAYTAPIVTLPNTSWSGTSIQDVANSIMIRVQKSGTLYLLTAPQGEAASKIAVGTDYEWCDERQDIDAKYNGKFKEYVGGQHTWNTWYK